MKFSIHFDRISLLMLLALVIENHLSQTLSLLIAALLHECGHLLAARIWHIPIVSLHISILGARLEVSDSLLSYWKEWALCASGPLFSFLFAGIAAWIASTCYFADSLRLFAMTSLALGLVNLLPVGWLDGGRMFRAMILLLLPHRLASALIHTVSFVFLLLLWMTSVYLLLRVGNSLSLFIFSLSLFFRFFLSGTG